MINQIKILIIIGYIFLNGCTTGNLMTKVQPDMSKNDVIKVLGNPDSFQKSGEYSAIKYSHRLVSPWAWDRADYFIIFKDNKVVEYGMGEVRVKDSNSNILILVPLK